MAAKRSKGFFFKIKIYTFQKYCEESKAHLSEKQRKVCLDLVGEIIHELKPVRKCFRIFSLTSYQQIKTFLMLTL